jgi:hypothetical protein
MSSGALFICVDARQIGMEGPDDDGQDVNGATVGAEEKLRLPSSVWFRWG